MAVPADKADVCDGTRTSQKPPSVQLAYVLGSRLLSAFGLGIGTVLNGVENGGSTT